LKKSQLSESKRAVNDVKFAPRNFGLKIATASADGFVRIYEASDVFSLTYWPMQVSNLLFPLSLSRTAPGGGIGLLPSDITRSRSKSVILS
jgi:WD40 repeat protein